MVHSPPSSSPPPKWNSNLGGATAGSSGQLLQELEALSQALYQSQKKPPPSQGYASQPSPQLQPQPAPAKKHSFLSRRASSHSGRRLSHDTTTDQTSSVEPIPFSTLSPHDPPASFTNLLSRHSLSSGHAPPQSFEQQKPAASNSRPRFSSSVISSHKSSAWGEEKPEVRSRADRRLSLQPSQSKNQEKSIPQEQQDSFEDPLDSSRRFDSSSSDKKKSVWSWKPFRALSHLGRQRLHCVFSAYVHAIDGLPPAMNGLRLCVHMRKEETKEGAVQTMPSRVFQGIAEFQETLFMKCTLYGNKSSSNTTKFMEKAFIVSVIAPDIDELDFGRHQLDLSRLLGDFMDERKGQLEKGSSWDTILDLAGKARGGRLAITFNYEILDKDSSFSGNVSSRFRESPPHRSSMHTSFSLPNSAHGTPRSITTRAHMSHSPSVSEPGNDYDELLAMDQFNLDEPPPSSTVLLESEVQEPRGGQTQEVQSFPAFRSQPDRPPMPSQTAFNAFPSFDSKVKKLSQTDQMSTLPLPSQSLERVMEGSSVIKEEDELTSEDEDEFVVVDQGVEIVDSMEKHLDGVVEDQNLHDAEEEASDDLIPHVVEMDAMDDLPQVVDIEVLDDLPPQVVDMDAVDDHSPHMVEIQALDDPRPSLEEVETMDAHSLHVAASQVPEREEFHNLQVLEDDDERSMKKGLDSERLQTASLDVVESSGDDKEVQEDVEKIVTVDEGERKDNVTYTMVMQTLDTLLQGTSLRESPQEEEKVEVESSADGIFSEEEDAADKEVVNVTSRSDDPKNSVMEVNADVYDTRKNVEDDSSDSDDFEEKGTSSKDIKEVSVDDIADEHVDVNSPQEEVRCSDVNIPKEEERFSDVLEEVGEDKEACINVRHAEDRSFSASDDEGVCDSKKLEEEESSSHVFEESGLSNLDTKEERHINVVRECEEASGGLEEETSGDKDSYESNAVAEAESFSMSSNTEVSLMKETTDRKLDNAVYADTDDEVDLVAGEFLDMLGMGSTSLNDGLDSEVDSPRARLLKEFEEEAFLEGGFGLDFDVPEFSLDGASGDENAGWQPNACLQESVMKGVDKEPTDGDLTPTSKPMKKDHTFALSWEEEQPTKWDYTSAEKGLHSESTDCNHTIPPKGMEKELSEGANEDLADWDSDTALKVSGKEPSDTPLKETGKEPSYRINTLDSKGIGKETGKEPSDWKNNLDSKGIGKEPAAWDETLGFKEIDKDLANVNLPLALEKEPADPYYSSALKMKDEDLAWTHALALRDFEKEHVNSEMEKKLINRDQPSGLAEVDNQSPNSDHTAAPQRREEEPARWNEFLGLKGMDKELTSWNEPLGLKGMNKEPVELDHNLSMIGVDKKPNERDVLFPLEKWNDNSSHWDQLSTSEVDKVPLQRNSDSLSDAVDSKPANWDFDDDVELMSLMEAAESELQRATQSMHSKSRAKMLEDEETEALMQEWGLNEKVFVSSPPRPTIRQQEPPPLGKGLGATVPLKDGGSLRSMNPSFFQQANKSNGKLVMQISKPVVVPAEMGADTVDILRNMASMGVENMAVQAMTAMPLEDITGRSVEQVAIDGTTSSKSGHRLLEGSMGGRKELTSRLDRKSRTSSQNVADDVVSLEDIAPMAMQQIEALALDGLKIQADEAEDQAPFALNAFSLDGLSGGKDASAGSTVLKGVTGVSLPKGTTSSVQTSGESGGNGLMGMAISLDEWMLLDAGLYDEQETKKDALAIMAAHHAAHQEIVVAGDDEKRRKRQGSKNTGARWGCMGNTLTIAMLVQLRDPLKNNEAVGAPMMAFVQAERMMKPPKMKVGRNVSMKGNSEDEEAAEEPQFKITGVHMSGLKASQEEKRIGWGNQKQLQSGSRWLIANGMAKNAKVNRPMLASKPAVPTPSSSKANASKGESIWSISSRALSSGLKWRDNKLRVNGPARNPDVVYDKSVGAK